MKNGMLLLLLCSTVQAGPSNVEDLQREKVIVLKQIYDDLNAAYQDGQVMFREVCKAKMEYLEGTLDLAKTHPERLRIHQELIKAAEDLVKIYEKLVSTNEAGRPDLLRAKVVLLDRRIALAKEEQAAK